MFVNGYPYSDYDQINLDWVIKTCQEALDKALQAIGISTDTKDYVDNYFANLDVQQEVNTKIEQMANDGDLLALMEDTIADIVTQWLTDHIINPSSPPLDSSLTIATAAAQSKAVGDALKPINTLLFNGMAPFNEVDYTADFDRTNHTSAGVVMTYIGDSTYTLVGTMSGSQAVWNLFLASSRLPTGLHVGDTFRVRWSSASGQAKLQIRWYINGVEDINNPVDISTDTTVTIPAGATGARIRINLIYSNGTAINDTVKFQFLNMQSIANKFFQFSGDLNDMEPNTVKMLYQGATYTNAPFQAGMLWYLVFRDSIAVQFGFEFTNGAIWYRRKSTTWGDWICSSDPLTAYRTPTKYVAFGDSITYGAVWSPTPNGGSHRVQAAWRLPARIALATGFINNFSNEAVGGIGYLKVEGGDNLKSKISTYNFNGVELVTIMAGANDKSTYPLGNHTDSSAANTICGAIRYIIETISAANPTTQIVIIQPSPSGVNGNTDDVWSTIPSGWQWSMDQFDAEVSQLCEAEHVAYLNWNDSSLCRNWKYVGYSSGTTPNYTHPTNDDDYYKLGDFIAGKVAAVFTGLAAL